MGQPHDGRARSGEIVESVEYEPLLCPQGCVVRRFGADVPLVDGANALEIRDSECTDTLAVNFVPYPTDCVAQPTISITTPTTAPSFSVASGSTVTLAGDSTGELESFTWYASLADSGMWAFSGGAWQVTTGPVFETRTVTVNVWDRCGVRAEDSVELIVE